MKHCKPVPFCLILFLAAFAPKLAVGEEKFRGELTQAIRQEQRLMCARQLSGSTALSEAEAQDRGALVEILTLPRNRDMNWYHQTTLDLARVLTRLASTRGYEVHVKNKGIETLEIHVPGRGPVLKDTHLTALQRDLENRGQNLGLLLDLLGLHEVQDEIGFNTAPFHLERLASRMESLGPRGEFDRSSEAITPQLRTHPATEGERNLFAIVDQMRNRFFRRSLSEADADLLTRKIKLWILNPDAPSAVLMAGLEAREFLPTARRELSYLTRRLSEVEQILRDIGNAADTQRAVPNPRELEPYHDTPLIAASPVNQRLYSAQRRLIQALKARLETVIASDRFSYRDLWRLIIFHRLASLHVLDDIHQYSPGAGYDFYVFLRELDRGLSVEPEAIDHPLGLVIPVTDDLTHTDLSRALLAGVGFNGNAERPTAADSSLRGIIHFSEHDDGHNHRIFVAITEAIRRAGIAFTPEAVIPWYLRVLEQRYRLYGRLQHQMSHSRRTRATFLGLSWFEVAHEFSLFISDGPSLIQEIDRRSPSLTADQLARRASHEGDYLDSFTSRSFLRAALRRPYSDLQEGNPPHPMIAAEARAAVRQFYRILREDR